MELSSPFKRATSPNDPRKFSKILRETLKNNPRKLLKMKTQNGPAKKNLHITQQETPQKP